MKAITKSNVISANDYKSMVLEVLEFAGKTVSKTLGPCANTSIIEEMGPLVASKDGFHTLQRIRFAPEDIFANNVMNVIQNISHRMVSSVGDGSSSAVVAAWKFAKYLNLMDKTEFKRPRTLNSTFNKAIEDIIDFIQKRAGHPTKEELPDVMYKTAYVSTNGDKKFAELIRDAYRENPEVIFNVRKSPAWATETTIKMIDGYKANHYYMVDPIFHNVPGEFVGKDVYIICFDMSIEPYHYNMIHRLAQLAHQQDEDIHNPNEVIIVAPSYSQNFLDMVKRDVDMDMQLMRAKQKKHLSIRYMRCLCVNGFQRNEFMDFAQLCGSNPITASDFNKMVDVMKAEENFDDEILTRAIGKVDSITSHRNEYTIIDGFPREDRERLALTFFNLSSEYERECNENMTRRVPSVAFVELHKRIQKLRRRIAEVTVGADNEIEMTLKFDAAEDATRACESVAQYGYNVGGNIAIINATAYLAAHYEGKDTNLYEAYNIIHNAFFDTYMEVLANKYDSTGFDSLDQETKDKLRNIGMICAAGYDKCYDLIAEEYTADVINSTQTDIEILKGAINICLTLMTANQYISQIPTVKHEDD